MPNLIIHGGLFNLGAIQKRHIEERFHEAMVATVKQGFDVLQSVGARACVLHTLRTLEDEPLFNAGTGSKMQLDKKIRMSAALIDSQTNCFSGVINIQGVKNPIEIANLLSREEHHILADEPATQYARHQGIAEYDPAIAEQQMWYEQHCLQKFSTVGAVALDVNHIICAGTSTGGIGCELPGRVSDSATVAGTYATNKAGVSCTGIGEHIINQAVAAKIVSRVQDGMTLQQAVNRTLDEGREHQYHFGFISLDVEGNMIVGKTLREDFAVVYASYDGDKLCVFP
ncbi:MAG: isoaspartyl peptidase/L-asparaginase [Thiotrichaceae bacterium]